MMLPSPDSTGAQNHDRKPNGIPLDSVRPENALGRDFMSSINFIAHRPSMRWQPFVSRRGSGPSAFKEHYKLSSSECKSKSRENFKKFATIASLITIHLTIYFHPYDPTHIL